MLTLAQLLAPTSVATWRALLLAALQGVGPATPGGLGGGGSPMGTGSLSLSGTPVAAYPGCVLKVSAAGELGTAQVQLSLDGGASYAAAVTVPANGVVTLGATGVTATFAPGPAGAGTSFQVGDTWSFALSISPLPVSSWQSGGLYRTLVEIEAQALAELSAAQAALAASGLTSTASGGWLDQLAANIYGLTRSQPAAATVSVLLTAAPGVGPYNVVAGALTVADGAGHRFVNTGALTIPLGGSVTGTFAAESTGAAYNVAPGTITALAGGLLAGVSCSNAVWASGGSDLETDDSLRARCQARWQTIGTGSTAAVYASWAKAASASVAKVRAVADSAVAGNVNVYIAGANGVVGAPVVSAVDAYVQPRIPLATTAVVQAAVSRGITVAGAVSYRSSEWSSSSAVLAAITDALNALINSLQIGDAGSGVKVVWSSVVAAIQGVRGVISVSTPTVNGGTSDVVLNLGEVATLASNACTATGV